MQIRALEITTTSTDEDDDAFEEPIPSSGDNKRTRIEEMP